MTVPLQERCPSKSYVILEKRDNMGGTWDLFRYPGIRSDSDMYTLGFRFRPWKGHQSIADGKPILDYVKSTAAMYGIDKHIRFNQRVMNADWSNADNRWTVRIAHDGTEHTITCSFLFVCSGYYNYEQGYSPEFPGAEDFTGPIIHPQHWPENLDYADKNIVVIGSGATAVTLVPALADSGAKHVTMLQRSPTYIISQPDQDPLAAKINRWLPEGKAYTMIRWKNVVLQTALYQLCLKLPQRMRKIRQHPGQHAPSVLRHVVAADLYPQILRPIGDSLHLLGALPRVIIERRQRRFSLRQCTFHIHDTHPLSTT